MKKQVKKLVLAKDTVRALEPGGLQDVKGGLMDTNICPPYSAWECN